MSSKAVQTLHRDASAQTAQTTDAEPPPHGSTASGTEAGRGVFTRRPMLFVVHRVRRRLAVWRRSMHVKDARPRATAEPQVPITAATDVGSRYTQISSAGFDYLHKRLMALEAIVSETRHSASSASTAVVDATSSSGLSQTAHTIGVAQPDSSTGKPWLLKPSDLYSQVGRCADWRNSSKQVQSVKLAAAQHTQLPLLKPSDLCAAALHYQSTTNGARFLQPLASDSSAATLQRGVQPQSGHSVGNVPEQQVDALRAELRVKEAEALSKSDNRPAAAVMHVSSASTPPSDVQPKLGPLMGHIPELEQELQALIAELKLREEEVFSKLNSLSAVSGVPMSPALQSQPDIQLSQQQLVAVQPARQQSKQSHPKPVQARAKSRFSPLADHQGKTLWAMTIHLCSRSLIWHRPKSGLCIFSRQLSRMWGLRRVSYGLRGVGMSLRSALTMKMMMKMVMMRCSMTAVVIGYQQNGKQQQPCSLHLVTVCSRVRPLMKKTFPFSSTQHQQCSLCSCQQHMTSLTAHSVSPRRLGSLMRQQQ